METEKNVSVIIPTYNRELFLKKAIESVLGQSYKSFELIVVDDGSEDRTPKLVAGYGRDVTYIRQDNKGPAAARNTGIKASNCDLLAFLDSDDWFHEKKLEIQVGVMNRNPSCPVSHTEEIWYRRGELLNQKDKHRKASGDIFKRCLEICAVGISTVMLRKEIFETIGLFDEDLPCCEDYDFWLRASVRHRFILIDQPLTFKDGGRLDQVSYIHRVGMDRFRIRAIRKCLETGELSQEQAELALFELDEKCRIYGEGCIKHGRAEEGNYYLELPGKYKS